MNRLIRFTKILFKLVFLLIFLLIIASFLLVRFTDLTISNHGKAILGYNEENKNWVINDWELRHLNGLDGPYIFKNGDNYETINVIEKNSQYIIKRTTQKQDSINQFNCSIDKKLSFRFYIRNEYPPDSSFYSMPDKLIAISDIEGNFNAFYSFLLSNSVIDKDMNWTFNNGHLVLVGDFMDRGEEVTQVLWLIYKLEEEAKNVGGKIHFILGNHEVMNLNAQVRYIKHKYIALAQKVADKKHHQEAYKEFLSNNNELVKWLKSKNVITQIGANLFVHAGISPELSKTEISIEEINQIATKNLNKLSLNKENENIDNLVMGSKGPLWYRGLAKDYGEKYKKINTKSLNKIMKKFEVDRIVIGHTVVDDISTDFEGKVVKIDVKHGKDKKSGLTKGILIEDNQLYKIDDLGKKTKI